MFDGWLHARMKASNKRREGSAARTALSELLLPLRHAEHPAYQYVCSTNPLFLSFLPSIGSTASPCSAVFYKMG